MTGELSAEARGACRASWRTINRTAHDFPAVPIETTETRIGFVDQQRGTLMSVRFFYVDESYDAANFCLSAIAIRHAEWQQCFAEIKNHRIRLRDDYGIPLHRELHAHDFVAGRGRISAKTVGKWDRTRIFYGLLQLVARLPELMVFNVCLKTAGISDPQMRAWERLINRIERTMLAFEEREIPLRRRLADSARRCLSAADREVLNRRLDAYRARAFIVSDEGKEEQITSALRRMHVHNPIPSKYGQWTSGQPTKNIVTERIIEDPFFKRSHRSYFIQLADCVAYALLKQEVPPTPHVKKYGIDKMFGSAISGVCFRGASPSDPLGIVRG